MKTNKIAVITLSIISISLLSSCKLFKKDKCDTCPKWSQVESKQIKNNA